MVLIGMSAVGTNRAWEWHHGSNSVTSGCCISWHQDSAPLCLFAIRGKLEHMWNEASCRAASPCSLLASQQEERIQLAAVTASPGCIAHIRGPGCSCYSEWGEGEWWEQRYYYNFILVFSSVAWTDTFFLQYFFPPICMWVDRQKVSNL